jgi:hypothetical protein
MQNSDTLVFKMLQTPRSRKFAWCLLGLGLNAAAIYLWAIDAGDSGTLANLDRAFAMVLIAGAGMAWGRGLKKIAKG